MCLFSANKIFQIWTAHESSCMSKIRDNHVKVVERDKKQIYPDPQKNLVLACWMQTLTHAISKKRRQCDIIYKKQAVNLLKLSSCTSTDALLCD